MKNKKNLPQKSGQNNFPAEIPTSIQTLLSLSSKKLPVNPLSILELYKEMANLKADLEATKEVEHTKREYIAYLKEKTLKELDILANAVDKIAESRIENIKKSVEKELFVIDVALRDGNIEMLKIGLSALIRTLETPIISEEDLKMFNKALDGDSSVEIEI
jgi:hypothetical protein